MRKFLTSLAAISLIGGLFIATPARVAAAGAGTVDVTSSDLDIIHNDVSRESSGEQQTYLAPAGSTLNMEVLVIEDGDDQDLDDYITFSLKNGTFSGAYGDDNGYPALDDGDLNPDACDLNWTDTNKATPGTATIIADIDCGAGFGADGAPDHTVTLYFNVVIPAGGSSVLTIDSAAADVKVYFFAAESGDDIYLGSGALPAVAGDGNCTNPDFSTNGAAQGTIDEAFFAALAAVDENSDTIIVCNGSYLFADNTEEYLGADLFDGTIHIEEATGATVTFDGDESYQFLQAIGVSFEITGIRFLDGYDSDYGGAIELDNGNLGLDETAFESNYSSDYGGAVHLENGALTIDDSSFSDNRANDDDGGAIYHLNGALSITDSTFMDGWVEDDGGAIWHRNGSLTCLDSSFETNYTRDEEGGAIWHRDGSLDLDGCDFTENSADEDGGAVWAWPEGASVDIDNGIFEGNISEWDEGGAIYVMGDTSSTYISNSTFTGNNADYEGGAVWLRDDATIGFSTFTDNTSGDDGGAVFFDHDDDDYHVHDSTFTDNTADSDAGAIGADGDILIEDSRFVRNTAGNDYGGAVEAEEDATVTGSMFLRNNSGDEGGGLFVEEVADISSTRFIRNYAVDWGGGLSAGGVTTIDSTVFRSNHSRKGGAIDSFGSRLYLESRVKFIGNYASLWGGAIARESNESALTLLGDIEPSTVFRANRSRVGGPVAIYRGVDRLLARQAARIWKSTGASVYIVRDAADGYFIEP